MTFLVCFLASFQPPWPECENNFAIMYKVGVGATPAIPESLSEEGQDFLLCCFLHDPYERQTASELMDNPFVKVSTQLYLSVINFTLINGLVLKKSKHLFMVTTLTLQFPTSHCKFSFLIATHYL